MLPWNNIVRMIFNASRLFGASAVEAWKEASKKAAINKANKQVLAKSGNISIDEAKQILHIEPVSKEDLVKTIEERYSKLHGQNDPKKGGSLYLQSKISCAKIRLETALKNKEDVFPK
eukprot:TRINITY_DN42744_c0_g2_i1.p1 TRINITY_DN42744_c0_g2~~TRINITY_DN42744_c0_g2_i1.p1  ORF type:complete len:118 (-),score=10.03 TRINITY_DN42744_c0_g2_i1:90-443(-)